VCGLRRQTELAQHLADLLENHAQVESVSYPGLVSHPQYDLAKRQMELSGGLVTFDVRGGLEAGVRFVESLRIAQLATSLGGPETLVTHPASTTHVGLMPDDSPMPASHPGRFVCRVASSIRKMSPMTSCKRWLSQRARAAPSGKDRASRPMPEILEVESYRRHAELVLGAASRCCRRARCVVSQGRSHGGGLHDAIVGRAIVRGASRRQAAAARHGWRWPDRGHPFRMTGRLVVDGRAAIDRLEYGTRAARAGMATTAVAIFRSAVAHRRRPPTARRRELDPDEAALGPDALALTKAKFIAALAGAHGPIKARLMDQGRLAGLGNLLTDEALWRARIDPARDAGELDVAEYAALHRAIRQTLRLLGERGGSHTAIFNRRGARQLVPTVWRPLLRRTIGGRPRSVAPAASGNGTNVSARCARSANRRLPSLGQSDEDPVSRRPPQSRSRVQAWFAFAVLLLASVFAALRSQHGPGPTTTTADTTAPTTHDDASRDDRRRRRPRPTTTSRPRRRRRRPPKLRLSRRPAAVQTTDNDHHRSPRLTICANYDCKLRNWSRASSSTTVCERRARGERADHSRRQSDQRVDGAPRCGPRVRSLESSQGATAVLTLLYWWHTRPRRR
jgi:hypothetical protein